MGRFCIAALVCFLVVNNGQAQKFIPNEWVFPLKIKPSVSGSFGELRSNHFHSGIDLSTHGKTGYRVYSSDKGFVSRIKVSPYGYGKAVYVTHPGGYTTVYGHLEQYSERIDSVVLEKQYKEQSFAIEMYFKPGDLPVEKGEVIAYSGNSGGSGGPHLHYEVRETASQKPTDPLFFRQDVEDDVKPQIQGVKVYALQPGSFVERGQSTVYLPTVHYDGKFHLKGRNEIKALGEIGVGVQVLDYYTDSWRKCGVSSIELFANDTLVFHSLMDGFSFAESRYINSHIDYGEKKRTGKVIQKSYVEPNNQLSIYQKGKTYTVRLNPGEHTAMKYIIKDVSGNTSVLTFTLIGAKMMNGQPAVKPANELKYAEDFSMDSLGFFVHMPAKALYTNVPFHFYKEVKVDKTLAPVYSFGDHHDPVHKRFEVKLQVPDSLRHLKDKLFIAGVTATGKIYYLGGTPKGSFISANVRSFGRFSLAADTLSPTIRFKSVPKNANYSNHKTLQIIMKDDMSGINKYNCFIDGQWALFEYDAKRNMLEGAFEKMPFLNKNTQHQLLVKVVDNRGNQSERKLTFTY
ncbi:MAG: M23 family metallopeptidase [Marinilabiliaceae bacterium]|nr:M23 family metallopeptidase [Marinilabiliaceae bacterium]